jgi:cysteine-rich repeat protein
MQTIAMRGLLIALSLLALAGRPDLAQAVCGNGTVEAGEQCDDGNTQDGDCCSSTCQFEPAGSVCRPEAGQCDVAETCTGTSGTCPPDELSPARAVCRPAAGVCDLAETCTGTSAVCPPDAKSTDVCRPAPGDCDVAESCNGIDNDCPPDAFKPASTLCRAAVDQCDAAEHCSGASPTCPPDLPEPDTTPCDDALFCTVNDICIAGACHGSARDCSDVGDQCHSGTCDEAGDQCVATPLPNDTPCNDGDACTRTDTCQGGACTGANPVVCAPLDVCHTAGTCNPATGTCSNPSRPNNSPCDDADACTSADSCQGGVCQGLTVAGCCRTDVECDDGFACTEDRCIDRACVRLAHDERCAAAAECAQSICAPGAGAGASGCTLRAVDEGAFCSEDGDPCTTDACSASACTHQPDGSGSRCPMLDVPFQTARDVLALARDLEAAVESAPVTGCSGPPACDLTPGQERDRLVMLLGNARMDLEAALLAVSGRVPGASDPIVRARLALGLVPGTPGELRSFLATLAQARTRHLVAPAFARARRAEGRRVLQGTGKLTRQLRRLVVRRGSFVPAP